MSFIKWTVTVVVCLLVTAGLGAYKVMEIRAAIAAGEAYPEPSETVEAARVSTGTFTPTLNVIGELLAPRRLDLTNELPGEIAAVNFASGARVTEGQVLLQLDVSVEQANLEAARARMTLAQLNFDRQQELLEKRVSTQELLDQARAELTATQAEISVLQRTIEMKTLRSPFAGKAGLHTFEVGQYLPANTLVTSLIGDSEEMWVDFQVPQFYPQLQPGTSIPIATISAGDTAPRTASVLAENTVLNAGNRSRAYRATVANGDAVYSPHTMVELQVPIGTSEPVLQVPALAVQNDPLGQFVYLLQEDSASQAWRAVRQNVRVKAITGDTAMLENDPGLQAGMQIAAAGAFKLYEGIKVHIAQEAP